MTGEQATEECARHLILGLGNPGAKYERTRHNLGFRVVEEVARRRDARWSGGICNSLVSETDDATLAMPQTYMNRSGFASRCLLERRGYLPERTLVVYDEVALPLGRLRFRTHGSPGGHRGMESVIESLRTDRVPRLRVGIAPDGGVEDVEDLVHFVLEDFTGAEEEQLSEVVGRAADACECWLREGPAATMNQYNRS